MPGCLTHWLFGTAALEGAPQWALQNRSIVLAASAGTDPFFFYGRVPWRKRSRVSDASDFGTSFHNGHPRIFFKALFDSASALPMQSGDAAFAMVLGLLYHWQLDRHAHPYMYSRSGFNGDGNLDEFWTGRHARFETVADAAFARAQVLINPTLHIPPPFHAMLLDDSIARPLSVWLASVFPQALLPEMWRDSLSDMHTIYRFLSDRNGLKAAIFGRLKKMESLPGALLYPSRRDEKRDTQSLNFDRSIWLEPVTGRARTESLRDLFDRAFSEVRDMHELIERTRATGYDSCALDWDYFYRDTNHEGYRPGEKMRFTSIVRL